MPIKQTFVYLNEFGDALLVCDEVEKPSDSSYHFLRTLVQGRIGCAALDASLTGFECDLWFNDEDSPQGLYPNGLAHLITGYAFVGPVVLARCDYEDGSTLGLTEADLATLRRNGLLIDDNYGDGWRAAEVVALRESITEMVLPPDAASGVLPGLRRRASR